VKSQAKAHLVAAVAIAVLAGMAACRDVSSRPGSDRAGSISIAAASDLRYVLEELKGAFAVEHPRVTLSISYGSSGNFYAQLLNGAPFDVFLSADVTYPRQLAARGLAIPDGVFTYAEGRIAVWVPGASSLKIETLGLKALTDPAVSRVAIANPEHAPYGRAAEAAMRAVGILDVVKPKLVLGENISQTLQFVQSGSADVGIVALSLALAPPVVSAGRYWLVPADAHPAIEQGGAIMRATGNPGAAEAFRAFVLGSTARATLTRYGFTVPPS
jgi:molybdate transport system substrate-binding protein